MYFCSILDGLCYDGKLLIRFSLHPSYEPSFIVTQSGKLYSSTARFQHDQNFNLRPFLNATEARFSNLQFQCTRKLKNYFQNFIEEIKPIKSIKQIFSNRDAAEVLLYGLNSGKASRRDSSSTSKISGELNLLKPVWNSNFRDGRNIPQRSMSLLNKHECFNL